MFQAVIPRFMALFLPSRCPVTGEVVEAAGIFSAQGWARLSFIQKPHCRQCGLPFTYNINEVAVEDTLCTECLTDEPPFAKARARLIYREAGRELVLKFKHGDRLDLIHAFTPWLKEAGEEMREETDLLIPVPLHFWRLLNRRFNQSAILAQHLAKLWGKPVLCNALQRIKNTVPQASLPRKERLKNVRTAFRLNPQTQKQIEGKTILLVDDVYTTGSTLRACTETMLKAGAAKVNVLTIARVLRDGDL
ncbi:MAG: ComF family protein [Alphaproteobacteria bacterium]|nr:ComF family protein [Alphaproteobacteria bacterium]